MKQPPAFTGFLVVLSLLLLSAVVAQEELGEVIVENVEEALMVETVVETDVIPEPVPEEPVEEVIEEEIVVEKKIEEDVKEDPVEEVKESIEEAPSIPPITGTPIVEEPEEPIVDIIEPTSPEALLVAALLATLDPAERADVEATLAAMEGKNPLELVLERAREIFVA